LIGLTGVERDRTLVVAARAVRTFGYGCTSVLLVGMLEEDGFSPFRVGVLLAVASAGCVVSSVLMGLFADRLGRRRSLMLSALLMAAAGGVFAFSESYLVLVMAAFIGTISPSTNDNTPFSGVEQAILAQSTTCARRTSVFTRYNVIAQGAGALGGLAAAGLAAVPGIPAGDAAFAGYTLLAAGTGVLAFLLSPDAEAEPRWAPPLWAPLTAPGQAPRRAGVYLSSVASAQAVARVGLSRAADATRTRLPPRIRVLAGLFAVDAFAGGLAVQAILVWWFHERYGVGETQLGILFFAANLIPALAQLLAPTLAARNGLLATMLVPHFASNLLLLCVPLAPTFGVAAGLLLARQALSKIDVPARQAFTAAVVTRPQRVAAASMTTVARSVAVSASPLASSLLLTGPLAALGAPLLVAGVLAIGYDAAMWHTFRTVEPAENAT
jgi:MFS family permease